jgi:cytochrome c oxidase assembly protein subunit 15
MVEPGVTAPTIAVAGARGHAWAIAAGVRPSRTIAAVRLPRLSPRAYQRIVLVALITLVVIVVTGAAVRLTGSGLGCSDWPTCNDTRIVADMGDTHARIEFLNRMFTGAVSLAVIAAVLGSFFRVPRRKDLTRWSLGLVLVVLGNAVLGGITVLTHLTPEIVAAHFLLSIFLIWNGVVLYERAGHDGSPGLPLVPTRVRRLGGLLVGLALVVLTTGTVVTGTGPHGGDPDVERLPYDITEVARLHSVCTWIFLVVAIWTLVELRRSGTPRQVDIRAKLLVGAIVVQGGIGYTQYFTGVPPWLVIVHVLGSTLVWIAVLEFFLSLKAHPVEAPARQTVS